MQGLPESLANRLAYAILLCVVVAACAFTPLGYAVWFEDLKIHGDMTTAEEFPQEWDKSSLEVTAEGVYCNETVTLWAEVTNVGDEGMAGPTTAVLWYSEHGGPQKGAQVAGVEVEVPALPAGESVEITVPVPVDAEGTPVYGQYWIVVYQRPEHPSEQEVWSEGIILDKKTCPQPDELLVDTLTEEVTPLPDELLTPMPESTDIIDHEVDSPDVTPTQVDSIDHDVDSPDMTPTPMPEVIPPPEESPTSPPPESTPAAPPEATPEP